MAGRSAVTANEDLRRALKAMASGADRAAADRARAILLTLSGWTSARIAAAFGVREDTVRLWRSDFMAGGVAALARRVAAGPAPVKAQAALRVATPLLVAPVEDRPNWTLARLAEEIKKQEGVSISRSQLSKVLRKKGGSGSGGRATA
jgi:transposase